MNGAECLSIQSGAKKCFPPSDEGNQNVVADSASKHAVTLDEPILLNKEDVIK